MKTLKPKDILLPLLLLSILGTGFVLLPSFVRLTGRWVVFVLLAFYLLGSGKPKRRLSPTVTLVVAGYVGWCMLTSSWSEVPTLSFMKTIALVLGMGAALGGGFRWTTTHDVVESLDFIWPYAALALLAGPLGGSGAWRGGNETVTLYAGATTNPNFLGFIIATSAPLIFWRLYRAWRNPSRRLLWMAALAVYAGILYLTLSRSSYLIFLAIGGGVIVPALGTRRLALWMTAGGVALIVLATFAGALRDAILQRNLYKLSQPGQSVVSSRASVWGDSYTAAVAGGWAGVGYGISAGWETGDFQAGVTSVGYGREKGNSQLAIVEETGLVGLGLSLLVVVVVFRKLARGYRAAPSRDAKVLIGLVMGTLAGLLVQSVFEAWWDAPGSPEFVLFWVMTGVGLGVAQAVRARAASRSVAPTGLSPAPA